MSIIEREQRLHVNDLHGDACFLKLYCSFHHDAAHRPIRYNSDILSFPQHLRNSKRNCELADVIRELLFEPVPIETLDYDCGIVRLKHRVVKAGCLGHVPWHQEIDTAQTMQ